MHVKPKIQNSIFAYFLFFVSFFLFFFLRNHYYEETFLTVEGSADSRIKAEVFWDNNDGINNLESFEVYLGNFEKRQPGEKTIFLSKTGQKNYSSDNDEVWISQILIDKKPYSLEEIAKQDSAKILNGRLFLGKQILLKKDFESLEIEFVKHPHSGFVKVSISDESPEIFDLYAENEEVIKINFSQKFTAGDFVQEFSLPQTNFNLLVVKNFTSYKPESNYFLKNSFITTKTNFDKQLPAQIDSNLIEFIDVKNVKIHPVLVFTQGFLSLICSFLLLKLILAVKKQGSIKKYLTFIFIKEKKFVFWILFIFSFFVFTLWLVGQWPGIMMIDSFDSWRQTRTLVFNDWHPFLYSYYILLLKQFYDSPASVALFQILVTSALGSYVFYYSYIRGVKILYLIPFFLLFCFSIPIGVYNIAVLKDVPFAISLFGMSFLIYDLYLNKSKKNYVTCQKIILLAFLLFFNGTVRHNGVVFFIAVPLLILFLKLLSFEKFKKFAISFLIIFLCYFIAGRVLNIKENISRNILFSFSGRFSQSLTVTSKSYYYSDNYYKDEKIIGQFVDVDVLRRDYQTGKVGLLLSENNSFEVFETLDKSQASYVRKYLFMRAIENLPILVGDKTELFLATAIGPTDVPPISNDLKSEWFLKQHSKNLFDLEYNPKNIKLSAWQNRIIENTGTYTGLFSNRIIFWNILAPTLFLFLIFYVYKFAPASSIIAFLNLIPFPFLFIMVSSESWRYYYYLVFSAVLLFPLIFSEICSRNKAVDKVTD